MWILIESYLHLALYAVIGTVDELVVFNEGILVDVLDLHATSFVEPVLQSANGFVLCHVVAGVVVEEVV